MAQRVFLHVGAPKTGTTYLQGILWGNRAELENAGFLLPGTRSAHYQAMGDLRRGLWYDAAASWSWERMAATAADWPGTVIISEEMLGAATAEQATRAIESLRPAEVHVVVAGRDLWRTIPSSWQQAVRARGVGTFGRYVESVRSGEYPQFWEHQTPLPILRRWADGLPPEARHLVTVPPPGADPGLLWSRFAGALGIPDGLCRIDQPAGNVSLGAAETELLRRVNQALGDRYPLRAPYARVVHRHLMYPVLATRERGERFGMPAELADWAAGAAKQMVEDLRGYPCQVAGDLDDLVPGRLDGADSPDDLDDSRLLAVAIETIVGMLGHADSLAKRNDDLKRSAEQGLSRRLRRAAGRFRRLGGRG